MYTAKKGVIFCIPVVTFCMNNTQFLNSFQFRRRQRYKHFVTDHFKTNGSPGHHIVQMIKGSAKIKSRNKIITLSAGDIFYIPNGLKYHSFWYGDENDEIVFNSLRFYHFPMLDNYKFSLQKIDCPPSSIALFREITDDMTVNCTTVGKLYLFLGEVMPQMELEGRHHIDIAEIAADYMNTHTDFLISDVAEYCKVSESTLYSIFKKAYKMTPIEKKQQIFCERASELLVTTELSIEEISDTLGFSSSSYFRKIFKKHTNKTPMQVRKNIKNQI